MNYTALVPDRCLEMAWGVTVPGTYAESHIDQTAREACSAANSVPVSALIYCSSK